MKIRGVNGCSGIDYERGARRRNFDAECIIMAVRASTFDTAITRVEGEIEIIISQKTNSGIGKGLGLRRLACRQGLIITNSLLTQDPKQFFRRAPTTKF